MGGFQPIETLWKGFKKGINFYQTLKYSSETRPTLVATQLGRSNYLANQWQALSFAVPFTSLTGKLWKNIWPKPFWWAKLVYFDFALSNFNLQGHRLNSTEDALRVCTIYSSSFSVKLDKFLECWCPREGLTLKASKSNSNSWFGNKKCYHSLSHPELILLFALSP
jgi:hypothetical protein